MQGRVFVQVFGIFGSGNDGRATGGADHQGGGNVPGKEELFKSHIVRLVD